MNCIEVNDLSKSYGNNQVLNKVSFEVKEGEIHGFLGPNGAGKTTTMRLITKLENYLDGEIKILNKDLSSYGLELYQLIGILQENPPTYFDMRVGEYLSYALSLKKLEISNTQAKDYVNEALEKLDLIDVQDRIIGNLSRGFKQRVGVAQAIVHKPKLVILDEPTLGLDPKVAVKMRDLIKSFQGEYTVLVSSHLLHEMSILCDSVSIIDHGKIVYSASINELNSSELTQSKIRLDVAQGFDIQQILKTSFADIKVEKLSQEGKVDSFILDNLGPRDIRPDIVRALNASKVDVYTLMREKNTLEEIFFKVVQ